MTDILLDPLRDESIEGGDLAVLASWAASEGDHVRTGQPLARVRVLGEVVDVPAPHAGILEEILVPAGERFARGRVLGRLVAF